MGPFSIFSSDMIRWDHIWQDCCLLEWTCLCIHLTYNVWQCLFPLYC